MTTPPTTESPIFARFYDFTAWLISCVEKFPRAQRFILGSRLLDTTFACHAQLIRARKVTGAARAETLLQADVTLDTLRLQLRLAHESRCLSPKQYEYGANLLNQVGKLLGAWRKG
ncbi:MAG: diversity-generating retroelement protein Avd [Caldilineaceae bacterium]